MFFVKKFLDHSIFMKRNIKFSIQIIDIEKLLNLQVVNNQWISARPQYELNPVCMPVCLPAACSS